MATPLLCGVSRARMWYAYVCWLAKRFAMPQVSLFYKWSALLADDVYTTGFTVPGESDRDVRFVNHLDPWEGNASISKPRSRQMGS